MKIHHTDGNVYYLDFRRDHRKDDGAIITTCEVHIKVGLEETTNKPKLMKLSEGKSICHPNDKFDKDRGRRISMERALSTRVPGPKNNFFKILNTKELFTRESRKEFFRQYDEYIEGSKEAVFNGKVHPGDILNV